MRKVYYVYNEKRGAFDRVYPTRRQKLWGLTYRLCYGIGLGIAFCLLFLRLFGSPTENSLKAENGHLLAQYRVMAHRLDEALAVQEELQQRDDNLYRVILEVDPLPEALRKATFDNKRYDQFSRMSSERLVGSTMRKLDALERRMYVQSNSYDELAKAAQQNEEKLKCIPAIQPVANKDLKQTASGYGTRIDPIYGTPKFHSGMDFSAAPGTPVYVTGNGIVAEVGWEKAYGNTVVIDHGFGYRTKYAHLKEFKTQKGKRVVRGEVIGLVGSTGRSTGPHLHYEVHVKGEIVNPINYYFMDLSDENYEKMIKMAANHGRVYD